MSIFFAVIAISIKVSYVYMQLLLLNKSKILKERLSNLLIDLVIAAELLPLS